MPWNIKGKQIMIDCQVGFSSQLQVENPLPLWRPRPMVSLKLSIDAIFDPLAYKSYCDRRVLAA